MTLLCIARALTTAISSLGDWLRCLRLAVGPPATQRVPRTPLPWNAASLLLSHPFVGGGESTRNPARRIPQSRPTVLSFANSIMRSPHTRAGLKNDGQALFGAPRPFHFRWLLHSLSFSPNGGQSHLRCEASASTRWAYPPTSYYSPCSTCLSLILLLFSAFGRCRLRLAYRRLWSIIVLQASQLKRHEAASR